MVRSENAAQDKQEIFYAAQGSSAVLDECFDVGNFVVFGI